MLVLEDIASLKQAVKKENIALVPTMGNLHLGHISLVKNALAFKDQGYKVLVSIFVNPMQFGAGEDLEAYPRTLQADLDKLEEAGCDMVFIPKAKDIYPMGAENHTSISVPNVSQGLCAKTRPTHFVGVATIVAKLFLLSNAKLAFFGQKDYQQLAVIRKMVDDLGMDIQIQGVPIVRDENGLALSSRNGYLSAQEKQQAPELQACLKNLSQQIKADRNLTPESIEQKIVKSVEKLNSSGWKVDYLELRNQDLTPFDKRSKKLVLLVAAFLGKTRLIDNIIFDLN